EDNLKFSCVENLVCLLSEKPTFVDFFHFGASDGTYSENMPPAYFLSCRAATLSCRSSPSFIPK
ncbi:MAG: hypothetical protein Q4D65_10470, partial [Peptostreptococcaceae bacterium]|nr:hypothetical protein [Peptostreptococcaceae bacterium]